MSAAVGATPAMRAAAARGAGGGRRSCRPAPAARGAPPPARAPRGGVAAAAAAAPAAGPSPEELYTSPSPPAGWLGPVQAARYVGTGRGLEATRTLAPGDLLFVSEPLALSEQSGGGGWDGGGGAEGEASASGGEGEGDEADEGEEGGGGGGGGGAGGGGAAYVPTDADVDDMVAQLQAAAAGAPRAAAWLAALDNGTPERAAALPDLRALASASASAPGQQQQQQPDLSSDDLADLVDLNYSCLQEDGPLAALRAASAGAEEWEAPRDLVGVWPEASLLNHSCAPNVAIAAVEGRVIARAARQVAKQSELTVSYLAGPQLLAPLSRRQAALREARGFQCRCPRCRDEARQDPQLLQLVDDVIEACSGLEADLADAVLSSRARAVDSIVTQLAAFIELADAAFNKLGLPQRSQVYVQASLFRLYELAALATAAAGEDQPRLLELLAALAGEVAPGGEEHFYWARRYRAAVEEGEGEEGRMDGALRQADATCGAAATARYGQLPRQLYRRLMAAADAAEAAEGEEGEWDEDEEGGGA
ncbi:histone methyltransferase [Raphidocelis subcapitata]|uniref:Histone methyltransferase n=1 Tax=Raphidocelis subcapitata TaxID=307507 RepID=A0A2V0PA36_9CHLO|nr:histone methyltransferase [Raphidocelis subcapitata]|eukprot:GBF94720.1 histone methyltransferase [Raphidocelis subcapitata]